MVRAKMEVDFVQKFTWGEQVSLTCRYSDTPEDNSFAQATPTGNTSITVSNPALVGFFQPGQKFYLDFTEAK
ncbi:MAG: hypothetical protein WAV01_03585 [Candidatus Saccharimonadales bacterium]